MPKVVLAAGHVQPVWAGHPWVYAQAVAHIEGGATAGDTVDVVDPRGNWLGRGLYSPGTAIPVRLYTRNPQTVLDESFFVARINEAVERRLGLGLPSERTNAYRLIHAEGDGLPGLIVDVYGDRLVIQIGTVGLHQRLPTILGALVQRLAPRTIVDRTPPRLAQLERFQSAPGVLHGNPEDPQLTFRERGFEYVLPLSLGQKTGYYCDQRPLRGRVEQLAQGARVLDAYCYVGSFALAAARGGAAHVLGIDSSPLALECAAHQVENNGYQGRITLERGDACEVMDRSGRAAPFDLVICDPPKLSPYPSAREAASRTMRRIVSSACRALRPGGLLVLSSCSASLGLSQLTRTLALGARDAGRRPLVLERWFQGPDHPVPAAFPEGTYLTSLIASLDLET